MVAAGEYSSWMRFVWLLSLSTFLCSLYVYVWFQASKISIETYLVWWRLLLICRRAHCGEARWLFDVLFDVILHVSIIWNYYHSPFSPVLAPWCKEPRYHWNSAHPTRLSSYVERERELAMVGCSWRAEKAFVRILVLFKDIILKLGESSIAVGTTFVCQFVVSGP